MSGGVDSSVAAALLLEQGYDVVGCFMRLGSPGETLDELTPDTCDPSKIKIGHQGCCSINDAADARQVASQLGIPFYVCNFKKEFGRIIDYFVDEYTQGRTPNPCVRCNDWLKFGKLHDYAKQIDADFVASGHYARVEQSPEPRLLRGVDHDKDQSYVLFGATRDRLREMILPIGSLHKDETRDIAQRKGLPVFDKPDSQEICFVPDNDYAGLVERRAPENARAGEILDTDGNVVGEHQGQHRFTVGQRRGVGVALGYPLYVVGKDAQANTVTVGTRESLASKQATVGEVNFLVGPSRFDGFVPVLAQYRYGSRAVPAHAKRIADTSGATPSSRTARMEVRFDEPQFAVAPGQALVCYDANEPDVVLAGGWIESSG